MFLVLVTLLCTVAVFSINSLPISLERYTSVSATSEGGGNGGADPASGNPATLNGNINALFLRNNGGKNIEFSADNSIALNAILKR